MIISSAEFVASYPREADCPKDSLPEFAFIGRSNVGKSSLINMLTGRKGLAKVSATPGKTRLLNFFLINRHWHLVDLPGYGYARVSKSEQKNLASMLSGYLYHRTSLVMAFVLIDSNLPPTKIDLAFVNSLGEQGVPFVLLFTKTDRLKEGAVQRNVDAFMQELSKTWETLPTYFLTSAERRFGRDAVLEYIANAMKSVRK
jgi:GTP-binding protein